MKRTLRFTAATAIIAVASLATAGTSASATIDNISTSGGLTTFDIDLTNTGTTAIATFWYAWIPGEDFMPGTPSNVVSPTGWALSAITGSGNASDGKAIRWEATTPLAAGASLDGFQFTSTATASQIFGNSPIYGVPVGTSFVYEGAPFSAGSDQFVVQAVPEPSSYAALGLGVFVFIRRKKRS